MLYLYEFEETSTIDFEKCCFEGYKRYWEVSSSKNILIILILYPNNFQQSNLFKSLKVIEDTVRDDLIKVGNSALSSIQKIRLEN